MNARRLTLSVLALLCALALWGAPAQALVTHEFLFQFSEVPPEGLLHEKVALPGPLPEEALLAVDSGQVWIVGELPGTNSFSVNRFNADTGAFVSQFAHSENYSPEYTGIAVAHPAGGPGSQIYLSEYYGLAEYEGGSSLGVYSESGNREATWTGAETPAKSWGHLLTGLAVDDSTSLADWAAGDLYVADSENGVVDVFRPEASGQEKYVTQLTGTSPGEPFTGPHAVAVDDVNGDVVVADRGKIDLFEPTAIGEEYAFVRTLTPPGASSFPLGSQVNADDGEGDIFVASSEGVFEFDSAGAYLGKIAVAAHAVAGDPTTHRVFIAPRGSVQAYGPNTVIPDVTTGVASGLRAKSATLNGTVNPDGEGEARCQFEWGTSPSFGNTAPCEPEGVAEGSSPVAVHANLGGLRADTTYYYRLRASNGPKGANPGGTNPGEASQDQQFTTLGPRVEQSATDVAGTSATLDATINPHGASTTYYFQYGTSAAYDATAPAPPGFGVGSGESDVSVSVHLQGLSLGTEYHYRVLALSHEPGGEAVVEEGPDETFTTQLAASGSGLLDGRGWELVSPVNKHGGLICPVWCEGVTKAALSGGAFTYKMTAPPEAEPEGYTDLVNTQMLATRGPSGWASRDISIPHEAPTGESVGEGTEYRVFSEDLSLAVVQPFGPFVPSLSVEASEQTPFLRTNFLNGDPSDLCVQSCFRPLVTGKPGYANVPPGTRFGTFEEGESNVSGCPPRFLYCGPEFIGATPDLRHIEIKSFAALTGGEPGRREYEWTDGHLSLGNHLSSYGPPSPGGGPWEYASSCNKPHEEEGSDCKLTVNHGGVTKTVAVIMGADKNILGSSPDGRWLAFMSQRSLTGYDNRDAVSGKPDEEVYLYHAPEDLASETGRLVCASCNPSGARPIGKEYYEIEAGYKGYTGAFTKFFTGGFNVSTWQNGQGIAATITAGEKYGYGPRSLSNDGRLFFDSSDALVPQDVNGTEDVYEYEPPGVGGCTAANAGYSARSGGCVGLVSSGGAVGESAFLDASESGADVFILTYGKLSTQDSGSDLDVYDAHECSSVSPCIQSPPVPPPSCTTGDACKSAPSPQPASFGAPASQTFSGAGNVVSPPAGVTKKVVKCPRRKKLGRGRCVKAKAKHRKTHKVRKAITNRRAGR